MLEVFKGARYLQGKLSRRCKYDGLYLARIEMVVGSQPFNDWQAEGEGLARTGEVTDYQVFSVINVSEGLMLNRKQPCDAILFQLSDSL